MTAKDDDRAPPVVIKIPKATPDQRAYLDRLAQARPYDPETIIGGRRAKTKDDDRVLTPDEWRAVRKVALVACRANGERAEHPCDEHFAAAEAYIRRALAIMAGMSPDAGTRA